jgi:hypothetical protein
MICSICNEEIQANGDWVLGNNAEPINEGRCCDDCNWRVVIPARLDELQEYKVRMHVGGDVIDNG